jgi:putrescine transport system permease protein
MSSARRFQRAALLLGLSFLYLPIVSLVFYSFNASKLVSVWGGFSTRWYGELLHDRAILEAAWLSLRIAAINATCAVVLGTAAALGLARTPWLGGRALLRGLVGAPLVMPEVIMGLSTLLLFVALESAIGWPAGRGLLTITLAHITFSMAFVTLVVQSRLAGQDHALEDAAMDLGASPLVAFLTVTLPLLAPAVIAGWLLAFTLSLDDLVIASFVSGPGATTLPMLIYSRVRLGLSPEVNALAAVVIGLAMSVIGLAGWLLSRSPGQERGRD